MSIQYIGEMRWLSFGFPPRGWALCNGQILSINQNQALFSLLGTTYGGDGIQTFALPNMQGKVPVHYGNGFNIGQFGGEANHTLTVNEMTAHTHPAGAVSGFGTTAIPAGALWARSAKGDMMYSSAAPNAEMIAGTVGVNGGGQPHTNQQPYLALNLCIALQGIFPSRN
jgi:microcystin-dependent protein